MKKSSILSLLFIAASNSSISSSAGVQVGMRDGECGAMNTLSGDAHVSPDAGVLNSACTVAANTDGTDSTGGSRDDIFPVLLLIGAQKSGTTSLHHHLSRHPDVIPPNVSKACEWVDPGHALLLEMCLKEWHFFNLFADKIGLADLKDEYKKYFDWNALSSEASSGTASGANLVTIDATPAYLYSGCVPERVASTVPNARIVVILRNPVERTISHYRATIEQLTRLEYSVGGGPSGGPELNLSTHSVTETLKKMKEHFGWLLDQELGDLLKTGLIREEGGWADGELESFSWSSSEVDSWLLASKKGQLDFLSRGLYSIQLRNWFRYIPYESGQYLILKYEDIFESQENTREALSKIIRHAGLREYDVVSGEDAVVAKKNPGIGDKYNLNEDKEREKMERFFEPYNRQLEGLLGSEWRDVWRREEEGERSDEGDLG